MIIEELLKNNRVRHYSDQNMMIRQIETENLYEDAVDALPCRFSYEETDIPIIRPIEEDIPTETISENESVEEIAVDSEVVE